MRSGIVGPSNGSGAPQDRRFNPPQRAKAAVFATAIWALAYTVQSLVVGFHHDWRSFTRVFTVSDLLTQIGSSAVILGAYCIIVGWRPSRGRWLWTAFAGLMQVILIGIVATGQGRRGVDHNDFGAVMESLIYALLVIGPLVWCYRVAPRRRRPRQLRPMTRSES